jgi:hypothetical protein
MVERVHVQGVRYTNAAFRLGANNNFQADDIALYNCLAVGAFDVGETTFYQAGFKSDAASGNTLNHWFYSCGASMNRRNWHALTCQQWIYGADAGHAEVDFYVSGDQSFAVNGWRSESSGRMLEVTGGTSVAAHIALRDGQQGFKDAPSANRHPFMADARMIVNGRSGPLLLENVSVSSVGIAAEPLIYLNNASAGKKHQLTLLNCNISTPVNDLIEIGQANSAASVLFLNHTVGDDNTLAANHIPFRHQNYSGAIVQPQFYAGIQDVERLGVAKAGGGEYVRPRVQGTNTNIGWGTGVVAFTYFRATLTEPIVSLSAYTNASAFSGNTTIRLGVYSVNESTGELTLVASTANDTALFQVASTKYTKALSSTWNKVAGTLYALGVVVVGGTQGGLLSCGMGGNSGPSAATAGALHLAEPRLAGQLPGQTTLEASYASLVATHRAPFIEMNV